MKAQLTRKAALFLFLGGAATAGLVAAPRSASAEEETRPRPPQLYAACQSKGEGEACAAQVGNRQLKGVCGADAADKRLSCRPAPPRPR
jgi:hypothetical protein